MRAIAIRLPDALYQELERAAREASKMDEPGFYCSPEDFAKECVEAVLAERRLERIDLEKLAIA